MKYKAYRVMISPGVKNLNFPSAVIQQSVDACLTGRKKDGFDEKQSSVHPMLLCKNHDECLAYWKVGVVIFPVEKNIYIRFPEECPPSTELVFYDEMH